MHSNGSELYHIAFRSNEQEIAVAAVAIVVVRTSVVIDLEASYVSWDGGHQSVGWTAAVSRDVYGKFSWICCSHEARSDGDGTARHCKCGGIASVPATCHRNIMTFGVRYNETVWHVT